jgi:hypothetical protein
VKSSTALFCEVQASELFWCMLFKELGIDFNQQLRLKPSGILSLISW